MTWRQYDEVFGLLAQTFRAEWKCDLPPFDTLPSEELDGVVSAWCAVLAKNLHEWREQPPEIVRPWLLVRVLSVQALARALAAKGDKDVPPLVERTLRQLLISEWHGSLRDRWPLLMQLDTE